MRYIGIRLPLLSRQKFIRTPASGKNEKTSYCGKLCAFKPAETIRQAIHFSSSILCFRRSFQTGFFI